MNEEKSLKRWIKRKLRFTEALLVAFLITGGISFSVTDEEFNALKTEVQNLKKVHYFSINSTDQSEDSNYNNDGATGIDSIAIGRKAKAPQQGTIAIGVEAQAIAGGDIVIGNKSRITKYGSYAIALGNESEVTGHQGNAIGAFAKAFQHAISYGNNSESGSSSVALGYSAKAIGQNSVSLGASGIVGGNYSLGMGYKTAVASSSSIVLGNNSLSSSSETDVLSPAEYMALSGEDKKRYVHYDKEQKYYKISDTQGFNVILGDNAKGFGQAIVSSGFGTKVTGDFGVALGTYSQTTTRAGVALGADSIANREAFKTKTIAPFSNVDLNNKTYGAVSVGKSDNLRQIINVGDGTEDTDAVNLRQMKEVDKNLRYIHTSFTAEGEDPSNNEKVSALKEARDSIAIGTALKNIDGHSQLIIGQNIELGKTTNHDNHENLVIGISETKVSSDENKTKVIGNQNIVLGRRNKLLASKTNLEIGNQNAIGIGHENRIMGSSGSIALGGGNQITDSLGSLALGTGNTISDHGGIALGNQNIVHKEKGIALGSKLHTEGKNTILIGNDIAGTTPTNLNLGVTVLPWTVHSIDVVLGSISENPSFRSSLGSATGETALDTGKNNIGIGNGVSLVNLLSADKTFKDKNFGATDRTNNAIVIGNGKEKEKTYAVGDEAIVIGRMSNSFVRNSMAIGNDTVSLQGIAFGNRSQATAEDAIALGADSKAENINSIALGWGSIAKKIDKENNTTAYLTGEKNEDSLMGTLSIGGYEFKNGSNAGKIIKRRITHVAGGVDDYDAVNVSQLKKLERNITESEIHYVSINSKEKETGSNYANDGAKKEGAIAIGPKASSQLENAISLGNGATVIPEGGGGSNGIAIGTNARSHLMTNGNHEAIIRFGRAKETLSGGIAIGQDTHSRIGNVELGNRDYRGQIGDFDFSTTEGKIGGPLLSNGKKLDNWDVTTGVGSTTVGDNSFNMSNFASIHGSYNIISKAYDKSTSAWVGNDYTRGMNALHNAGAAIQGFGSTISGSLNSIEANEPLTGNINSVFAGEPKSPASGLMYSGLSSSIVGTANRVNKSNGAIILGTGNEITNSYLNPEKPIILDKFSTSVPFLGTLQLNPTLTSSSIKELSDTFRKYSQENRLASVGIIGGANTADYTLLSNINGVGNSLKGKGAIDSKKLTSVNTSLSAGTGAESIFSVFNSINGYENKGTNVMHSVITGSWNELENTEKNLVMGNNHVVRGSDTDLATGNIILGFNTKKDSDDIKEGIDNVIILGNDTKVFGNNSIVMGKLSEVREKNGVSLGGSAKTSVEEGVALGSYSEANRAAFKTEKKAVFSEFDLNGKTYGAISVGTKEKLRQIINVGDATEATDAVNLRQLEAAKNKITYDTNLVLIGKADTNLGNITDDGKQVITNLIQVVGDGKIKVSTEENTDSKQKTFKVSLDEETMNQINKEESVSTAKDSMITVDASKTNTTGGKDFVLDLRKETKDKINSIGTGVIEEENKNTVTGGVVFDYLKNQIGTVMGNTAISYKADKEKTSRKVTASEGFHFQGDKNIQISTAESGAVKYELSKNLTGMESISNGKTTITLGKDKKVNFGESKLTNLEEGEVSATSTDAVTGAQLYKTDKKMDLLEKNSNNQMEAINKNAERIQNVKNEVGHVGALGAALAALHPMQYDPLQPNQVMAGLGHYRDKQAVAVGVTHYFNENVMMTAGVSVGNENRVKTMANVGITWKIGKDEDRKELPERYKEGPLGSIYIMQKEMEEVLQENIVQKEKLNRQENQISKQQNEIEEMKKQLQILLKK